MPPSNTESPTDLVLRGVCRVERVDQPEQYIEPLLQRCQKKHVEKTYEITGWNNHIEFLELLARKGGRLLRGGEPDLDGVAKMVLNDFMRGRLPWFTPVPKAADEGENPINGREGKLGEMPRKRKQEDETIDEHDLSAEAQLQQEAAAADKEDGEDNSEDESFEGFGSDTEVTKSRKTSFGATVDGESEEDDASGDVVSVDEPRKDDGSEEQIDDPQVSTSAKKPSHKKGTSKSGQPNKRRRT